MKYRSLLLVAALVAGGCSQVAPNHKPFKAGAPMCYQVTKTAVPGDQCTLDYMERIWSNPTDASTGNPNTEHMIMVFETSCTLGEPTPSNATYFPCVIDQRSFANGDGVPDHINEGDTVYLNRPI